MGERHQRLKRWRWCAVGLAIVALSAIVWRAGSGRGRVPMADTVLMVDVRSGQLFEMSVGRTGLMVPERHPQTGALGLFPVERDDSGAFVIPARMREGLAMVEGGGGAIVDRRTGVVKTNGAPAQRSRPHPAD